MEFYGRIGGRSRRQMAGAGIETVCGHRQLNLTHLSKKRTPELRMGYEEVGRMLGGMIAHPERFS
jgi:hypothetical protein